MPEAEIPNGNGPSYFFICYLASYDAVAAGCDPLHGAARCRFGVGVLEKGMSGFKVHYEMTPVNECVPRFDINFSASSTG